MLTYAMGGFGCGNLGDEAIFEAMKLEISELIQIYVNVPQINWDGRMYRYFEIDGYRDKFIYYPDLIENGFPEKAQGGELIIGGGGIFHSKGAIIDFVRVAERAKERNMRISIRKVGAEYMQQEFSGVSKELCDMSYSISVRSEKSAEILYSIGVRNVKIERDYSYSLKNSMKEEVSNFPKFLEKNPTVGIVTAGNDNLDNIVDIIRLFTVGNVYDFPVCNVVHIPHCRHFTDFNTNDVIGGEIIWSKVSVYHEPRYNRFFNLPFEGTVRKLLNVYKKVDGIIGMRYHSFIFSELADIPLFGISSGAKAASYFEEHKSIIVLDSATPISEYINPLSRFLQATKKKWEQNKNE